MKKVTAFECSDGKRFESKRDAEKHEAFLNFKADFTIARTSTLSVDDAAQALWDKHLQVSPTKPAKVAAPAANPPASPPVLALAS